MNEEINEYKSLDEGYTDVPFAPTVEPGISYTGFWIVSRTQI